MLVVRPLTDRKAIDLLYADPYIAQVGHDDRPAQYIDHPAVKYLGAYVNSKLVGAFVMIESGYVEKDLHSLLTKEALPHSRTLGQLCICSAFTDRNIARVTAYVMDGLTSARNYCLKIGFQSEGYRRDACRRNGQLVGVHILGITRKDWEKL